jgi:transcriptional regulator with XRE-family HTH domain
LYEISLHKGVAMRMPIIRLPEDSEFPETARLITNGINGYRARLTREARRTWKERDFAVKIGMQPSKFSEVKVGRRLPSLTECWRISQELGMPVEDFIRAAATYRPNEYPDVAALVRFVESDTIHEAKERTYILDCLRFSLSQEAEKLKWQESTYKQMADLILSSEFDPYTKAKFYADVVWDWHDANKRDLARLERKTDELAVIAS